MLKATNNLRALSLVGAVLALFVIVGVHSTTGQEQASARNRASTEEWEYLAVAGPGPASISVDPQKRKEPNVSFGREAYALEQHLDKLGANGWELVAVAGPPTDPAYYFKRRK
jgi:hypothetical protein